MRLPEAIMWESFRLLLEKCYVKEQMQRGAKVDRIGIGSADSLQYADSSAVIQPQL